MIKRTYAWRDGKLVELTAQQVDELHYVQDDIAEFQSPDGARIRGKAQWREHLKRTGSIEMGHSDMKAAERQWKKKREAFKERVQRPGVEEKEPPSGEIQDTQRSSLGVAMMNRLYNRATPDRKTLIKLTLETARDLARRR